MNKFLILFFLTGCSLFKKAQWQPPHFMGKECDRSMNRYNEQQITSWKDKKIWRIYFNPAAPKECPGQDHPAIGVQFEGAYAWIHIVRASFPQEKDFPLPFTYVDAPYTQLKQEIPFDSYGSLWGKNPFVEISDRRLSLVNLEKFSWTGYLFAVRQDGRWITPLGGLSWGLTKKRGSTTNEALPISPLTFSKWKEFLPLLRKQFPNYVFNDNIYQIIDEI